jgi:hypothetical protein
MTRLPDSHFANPMTVGMLARLAVEYDPATENDAVNLTIKRFVGEQPHTACVWAESPRRFGFTSGLQVAQMFAFKNQQAFHIYESLTFGKPGSLQA